jgi:RNA polymerase sigma-70 factor (ECF subfamily)
MDPDRQLVRMAKKGNKAAFGKLARRYRDSVLTLAYDFLKDYQNAQDVAQDVFMKAFKNIGDFEEKSRFSSWLYRITVNTSLDARKSKVRRRKLLRSKKSIQIDEQVSKDSEPKSVVDDGLLEAINNLSDHQHAALVLRYFHEKSIREIADILECTESTVRSHLHRALQNLQKRYGKRK